MSSVRIKPFLISSLAIAFVLVMLSSFVAAGFEDPFSEIKEKMDKISGEERKNLQKLFALVREIDEMEKTEAQIVLDIEKTKYEIEGLQLAIADEAAAYEKKRENLKQVLKSYQRMGPGSYLEIILDSDSLTTLLRRINVLRDLTRNTGELLDQLEQSKERQSIEKAKLAEKLLLMESRQKQFIESLDMKKKLKREQEAYLVSLAEKRAYYQAYLVNIQHVWDLLKPFFTETISTLSSVVEKGDLPPDAMKITYNFISINGTIEEKTLNDIIKRQPGLSELIFNFQPDRIEISIPEKNLILAGNFVILEGHILKFQVKEGSFYDLPLETKVIDELFQDGDLILNLKPLLGSFTLHSVRSMDGYLELSIIPEY